MKRRSVTTVLAVGSAVVALGCGSGTGSEPKSAHELTQAQYVKAAERICRETVKQAPAFPGKKDKNGGYRTTAAKVVPYLETIRGITRKSLQRLSALNAPSAKQAEVERLLEAKRIRLKGLNDALAAARKGDGAAFTAAFQRDQTTNGPRYIKAAAALGLKNCAL